MSLACAVCQYLNLRAQQSIPHHNDGLSIEQLMERELKMRERGLGGMSKREIIKHMSDKRAERKDEKHTCCTWSALMRKRAGDRDSEFV